ncbi:ferredoxin [Lysinimonas soli]|uniref:Ferredoxin n=1 Tax=Lysinimonas soli TaxID=1074233 RepID=A0ABW0NLF2_9MICO
MSSTIRTAAPTLHIDWTRCDARGSCTELLPELLRQDKWGYPLAKDGGSDVAIPAHLDEAARDAVALCPVLALRFAPPAG